MGYPTEVTIGDNLVFSIVSHDPDTGVVTDAAGSVPYRVYRDMETTALLTGNMTLMVDDAGAGLTTGLYRALIACTAANGFENGKTYTVYIEATVGGDKGGISFDFKAQEGWALASLWTAARAQALTDWIDGGRLDLLLDAVVADLPVKISKNTALANFPFFMVLASDDITGATGLTVTATRSIDGAAFASCANSVTEVANGIYKISLAASDLNGDTICLQFTAATANSRFITIVTQA